MHLHSLLKRIAALLLFAVLIPAPAFALDSEDSKVFIAGFNAYQRKDYAAAIEGMTAVLKNYPETTLKDMALFWLARAHYKAGHPQQAGKHMAQFLREYPQSPLKGTAEEELLQLAQGAAQPPAAQMPAAASGQGIATNGPPADEQPVAKKAPTADQQAIDKAAAEQAAAARKALADKEAAEAAAARAAEKRAAAKGKKRSAELRKKERVLAAAEEARNRTIASYKEVIDRYPGSAAAAGASAKLREMGFQYPPPRQNAVAPQQGELAQTFNLEVAQYADLEVTLGPAPSAQEAGKPFAIAFDVVNTGNGSDSFRLESGFPPEYGFHFAAASAPETPLTVTPPLAVGERFRMVAVGTVPASNMDGQKNSFAIRIVSVLEREVSQSREVPIVTSAPMLRAVLKTDKAKLLPGERVPYRISILNAGTAAARGLALRVTYPPQYEPLDAPAAGFRQEHGSLLLEALKLHSGEGKDFNLSFRVKDEALAEQELFLRADIANHDLDKRESVVSATSVVQRVSSAAARSAREKVVVVPGQALLVPMTVSNTGNIREAFSIQASLTGGGSYNVFHDLNGDGKREANEPTLTRVGPLSPREEAHLLLQIETPPAAGDGTAAHAAITFQPEHADGRPATLNLQLAYSRPILELAMAAQRGRLKPGEVSSLELNCVNRGSNLAKQVTVQSILPPQLELVAADPGFSQGENGTYSWRFDELGAGEKRNIRMTYRVKPGIAVGTSMQVKNLLNYHDSLGNRY